MSETKSERFPARAMDRAEYMDRLISDQQIHCVVTLGDRVDPERLARAVRITLDAEPVLGCRFVERPWRPYWERRHDLDEVTLFSLEEGSGSGEAMRSLMSFVTTPSDPRSDPLVQVRLFRSERDTVCVKIDHVAADTGGLKEYVYLLSDTYRRLAGDGSCARTPRKLADRSLRQVLEQFGIAEKAKAMLSGSPPAQRWGFPWRGAGHDGREFAVRRLTVDRLTAVKEYGKGKGATVNDCVLAAYYRALFELAGPEPGVGVTINVPIDLRRYRAGGRAEAVCNLSGQLYPVVDRLPGEEFGGTLARVRDSMDALKSSMPGIGSAMTVAASVSPGPFVTGRVYSRVVAGELRSGRCNPYLSNLGILEPGRLDFVGVGAVDAYLVSPLMFAPGFLLGISTFADAMTLTVGYADADANRPVVERFLDLVLADLVSLA